ncbi:dehydratase [Acrocarpospora corrugata]|uniref:Dehydratase n=1 Tax=Acrocarpospora corrugata TaxID=35763 RepID=A0A5M3W5T0_9ACTN|nr:CoA transferase [Acrocarpospora corrugata]GES02623.1 dehydratase [Acrocarpospora corrugata]
MTGPLAGLHILDLSTYVAGPSATMTLAQLGADVVRVDPIGGAPDHRRSPLAPSGASLYWTGLNKGKRSIEIDLRAPAGRELVYALLNVHGILVTNAPATGWLGPDALRARRADLIAVRISGHPDGRPAVDYTVNAEVGLPWITGPPGGPVNHVLPAWDLLTGLHAALAVVAAERARRRTGAGSLIDISLSDVAAATMGHLGFVADVVLNGAARERDGNYLYGGYGTDFGTADGRRVMIVALTERHWHSLVDLTGTGKVIAALEENLGERFAGEQARYRHRHLITALLAPWFARHTLADLTPRLDASQVLWSEYRTIAEFTATLGPLFTEIDQPGAGRYPVPGPVAGGQEPRPAPLLGQDTAAVLTGWLGLDAPAIADLATRRVVR